MRRIKFLILITVITALFTACEELVDGYEGNSSGSIISNGNSNSSGSQNWTPPTRIRIKSIQLSDCSYWCDSSWDYGNGPDVYVSVASDYNSTSYKTIGNTNVVNNLTCNMLPYVFDNLNFSTKYDYLEGTDAIIFGVQDKDNNGEETTMDFFVFSPYETAPKKYSDSYSRVLTFENGIDKFRVLIEYY